MCAASVSKWRRSAGAGVGQAEAVGAERYERLRHPARDLVGNELDEVGDGNDGSSSRFPARVARTEPRARRSGAGGCGVRRTALRHEAPCSWSRSRLRRQRRDDRRAVAAPRARRAWPCRWPGSDRGAPFAGCVSVSIQTGEDAFFGTGRHGRLREGLVVESHVVDEIFGIGAVHPRDAIAHDDSYLVGEGGIVRAEVRKHGREQQAVTVTVLQSFALQRGASRGGAQQESPGAHVARGPEQVPETVEAEHGVVDEERHHRVGPMSHTRCPRP